MEENEGKDLAQDMRDEEILEEIKEIQNMKREAKQNNNINVKYYDNAELKLGKNKLKVSIAEIDEVIKDKDNKEKEIKTYDVYMKYKGKDMLIANVNEQGNIQVNKENMLQIDPENKLGLQDLKANEKADLSILKELEGKTEKELEEKIKNKTEKENKKDKTEKEEEDNKEKLEKENAEKQKEEIAKKKNIPQKNIFMIRENSQFFKNYPNVPKTTYFYRDADGKFKAEFIDKDGTTKPSPYFNDSTTLLNNKVVGTRDDGEPMKKEVPYQTMTTNKLKNQYYGVRDVRVAVYIEKGYMEFEEIRQGNDGEWVGYGIEGKGKDYNSSRVNELSNLRTGEKIEQENITKGYEQAEQGSQGDDGVQINEINPRETIDRFIEEGYNKEEAIHIYNYMIGEKKLPEEDAKIKVNEEIAEKTKTSNKQKDIEEDDYGPWSSAEDARRG